MAGASDAVVGDFNGDGKADLAVNGVESVVGIVLGNGSGTFQSVVTYATPSRPNSVAVGDFNGDGKSDLAAACPSSGHLAFLEGKGDGTFQEAQIFSAGWDPSFVAAGDLNGDGKLDAVVTNESLEGWASFLGNGDGTFQTATAGTTFEYSIWTSISLEDFNGDGKLDLALTRAMGVGLRLLLGNGDGTFVSGSSHGMLNAFDAAVGEFSGDGKADIAIPYFYESTVGVFLGGATADLTVTLNHGHGFTQSQSGASYKLTVNNIGDFLAIGAVGVVATVPVGLTATNIAGTGWTCLLGTLTCTRSDQLAPGTSYPAIYVTINVAGNVTGDVTAQATVSGGSDGNADNNLTSDTTSIKLFTSASVSSSPNPSVLGQSVTLTATVSAGTGNAMFYDGTSVLGVATVTGTQAVLSTKLLASGSRFLSVRFAGDSTYGPSTSSILHTVNALATNGMTPGASYAGGGFVTKGDFNQDGRVDLVSNNGNVLVGNGDGTFQPTVGYSDPVVFSNHSVTGDFNGDGKLDLIVLGESMRVFLGNGNGTFQAGQIAALNVTAFDAVAADIDQDGRLDLIANISDTLGMFLGNGDGTFQTLLGGIARRVYIGHWAVADFNQDRKPDVVMIDDSYGPPVNVLLGNGDGTFQPPASYPWVNTYAQGLAVGDFNGDGKSDVLVTYWPGAAVLLGKGDGNFEAAISTQTTNAHVPPGNITLPGDFDGDGNLDFAYHAYSYVQIVFGNGNGTFQPASPYLSTDGYNGDMTTADFNGDGRPDLAVANKYNANSVNILLGSQFSGLTVGISHTGRLTTGQTKNYQIVVTNPAYLATAGTVKVTGTLPSGLSAAALTGEGWSCTLGSVTCTRTDSLGTRSSYPPITLTALAAANLAPSTLAVGASVLWNGLSNSASDPTLIVLAVTTTLAVSSNPAILGQPVTMSATVSGGGGSVTFFDTATVLGRATILGNQASLTTRMLPSGIRNISATYTGDSTHGPSNSPNVSIRVDASPASSLTVGSTVATGVEPIGIAMEDLNNDGHADLITPNALANTVSVLMGNGNGTFQAKTDYAVGARPVSVAIADFNGDGKPDFAVANQYSNHLSVRFNNGAGLFPGAVSIATVDSLMFLLAGDFDRDGNADLLAFQEGTNTFLFLGKGDGTFSPPSSPISSCCNATYAAGELNGDDRFDLITGYVYLGNGDGSFFESKSLGLYPRAWAIADLNGDGKADVVGAEGADVHVLLGNGDGTFQPITNNYSGGGSAPLSMAIADVNGDGKPDVITANSGSNDITIWFGAGNGTFPTKVEYATGATPHGVVAGDFNGDGRTDLAIANASSNDITILMGVLTPVLIVDSTHAGNFFQGQTGASYSITVSNTGSVVTSGTVIVTDTLPAGITATNITGAGWSCVLGTVSCSRSDALAAGASYPPITVTVNVAQGTPPLVVNQVSATGGGSPTANDFDATNVLSSIEAPLLLLPSDGAMILSDAPVLQWTASAWATSYDVYFGTVNPPPLVADRPGTSYAPGSVALGATYYWRVVAKNGGSIGPSPVWSFVSTWKSLSPQGLPERPKRSLEQ